MAAGSGAISVDMARRAFGGRMRRIAVVGSHPRFSLSLHGRRHLSRRLSSTLVASAWTHSNRARPEIARSGHSRRGCHKVHGPNKPRARPTYCPLCDATVAARVRAGRVREAPAGTAPAAPPMTSEDSRQLHNAAELLARAQVSDDDVLPPCASAESSHCVRRMAVSGPQLLVRPPAPRGVPALPIRP